MAEVARVMRTGGWVAGYYLATPLFAVLDLGFGVPVRLAVILPEGGRWAWYAAAFALGLLCAGGAMIASFGRNEAAALDRRA